MKSFTTKQVTGHGRGKLLGFPTINMEIPSEFDAKEGIYAAIITIGNRNFIGALHYGPVPVFGQKENSLEVFFLDTTTKDIGNITQFPLHVTLVKWLRPVQVFNDTDALIAQIQKDVERVRITVQEYSLVEPPEEPREER